MGDPIKQTIKTEKFNIYVWDENERIVVSWKNHLTTFNSMEEVKEINFLTQELIKEIK